MERWGEVRACSLARRHAGFPWPPAPGTRSAAAARHYRVPAGALLLQTRLEQDSHANVESQGGGEDAKPASGLQQRGDIRPGFGLPDVVGSQSCRPTRPATPGPCSHPGRTLATSGRVVPAASRKNMIPLGR